MKTNLSKNQISNIVVKIIYSRIFFQAEDGIRDAQESRGLGDVYNRQVIIQCLVYALKIIYGSR